MLAVGSVWLSVLAVSGLWCVVVGARLQSLNYELFTAGSWQLTVVGDILQVTGDR